MNKVLIKTWENAYAVSLGTLALYKRRLRELRSWDKPSVSKKDGPGRWQEWACKIIALENLIYEQHGK
jgi:hypothetical protein